MHQDSRPITRNKAKQTSNPTSTGGGGNTFETRVQASRLLALCLGLPVAGEQPEARILSLQFQTRVLGHHTDDLVCHLQRGPIRSVKSFMQMKLGLSATKSDINFAESLAAAWRDYHSDHFTRDQDTILIVSETAKQSALKEAKNICVLAKHTLDAVEWKKRLTEPGASSRKQREVFTLIQDIIQQVADEPPSDDEVYSFLKHIAFTHHDLVTLDTPEFTQYVREIETFAKLTQYSCAPAMLWAHLETVCKSLNAIGGSISVEKLDAHFDPRLVLAFHAYREMSNGALLSSSVVLKELHSGGAIQRGFQAHHPFSTQSIAIQDSLPTARSGAMDKLVSSQLDEVFELMNQWQHESALNSLNRLGQHIRSFDPHQQARWYYLNGICRKNVYGDKDADAARFLHTAADICDDDDIIATGRIRAFLLQGKNNEACAAADIALRQFPVSFKVWVMATHAKALNGEALSVDCIPPEYRNEHESWVIVADSLHSQGKLEEAAQAAGQALSTPGLTFNGRQVALAFALEFALRPGRPGIKFALEPKPAELLSAAVDALEPRSRNLWPIQNIKLCHGTSVNLALAYLVLDRPRDVITFANEAYAHEVPVSSLIRFELEAYAETNEAEIGLARGLAILGELPNEALVVLSQLAAQTKDLDALERIIAHANQAFPADSRTHAVLSAMQWDILCASGNAAKAIDSIERYDFEAENTIYPYVAAAIAYLNNDMPEKAEKYVELAIEIGDKPDASSADKCALAQMLHRAGHHAHAARVFSEILVATKFTPLHGDWLDCHWKLHDYAQCRAMLAEFGVPGLSDSHVRSIAIMLYQAVGDWDMLCSAAELQLEREPDKAVSWLLGYMAQSHDREPTCSRWGLGAPLALQGSAREQCLLAIQELRTGQAEMASARLYWMYRNALSDINAAATYTIALMLYADKLGIGLSKITHIQPGNVVSLRGSDGITKIIAIDPLLSAPVADAPLFISPTSEMARTLIGLTLDDEVCFTTPQGGVKGYNIVEIRSAHLYLLERSQAQHREAIVPTSHYEEVTLTHDSDGSLNLDGFVEKLTHVRANADVCFNAYGQFPMTLGLLGKQLNRNVIELVFSWPSNGPALNIANGIADEFQSELQLLASEQPIFVTDTATVAQLSACNALDVLASIPGLIVSPHSVDAIRVFMALMESHPGETLGLTEEQQLVMTEYDKGALTQLGSRGQAMLDAISTYAEQKPGYGSLNPPPVMPKIFNVLSSEEYAAVLLAIEYNCPLIALDGTLRKVATFCGIKTVGIQAVLWNGCMKGHISNRDYSLCVLNLMLTNRVFVSLTAVDLAFALYQGTEEFQAVMYRVKWLLSSGLIEASSLITMFTEFIAFAATQSNIVRAAFLELLAHLVEGLLRHPAIRTIPPAISVLLIQILSPDEIQSVCSAAQTLSSLALNDRPMRITLLKCSTPPTVLFVDLQAAPLPAVAVSALPDAE